jgi:hypothetical protein
MKRAILSAMLLAGTAWGQQSSDRIDQRQIQPPAPKDSSARQSNWIDESATPAGATMTGDVGANNQVFSPSAPEIRTYVAQLTDTALSPGGLSRAAQMLCAEDRNRLAPQVTQLNLEDHDQLVKTFREQWKTRYGEEFDLRRQRAVVADYYVLRGLRSPEEAIVASHQGMPSDGAGSVSRVEEHPQDQERAATVVVPPNVEQKQPAMILMLANEASGGANWRLNTPDSLTAAKLQQNLDERLHKFLDGQTKWPADSREAYRIVSYNVLATFNDQPADRPKQQPQQPKPTQVDNPSLDS